MGLLRIDEILRDRNIPVNRFAKAVGVSPASIYNILNGKHFPKPELLEKMAKELNVEVRDLFKSGSGPSIEQPFGFVEYKGTIFKITSVDDYKRLSTVME